MTDPRTRDRVLVAFEDSDQFTLVRKVVEDPDPRACSRWFIELIVIGGRALRHEGPGFKTRLGAESYMRGLRDGIRAMLVLGVDQVSYWAAHEAQRAAVLDTRPEPEPDRPRLILLPGGLKT